MPYRGAIYTDDVMPILQRMTESKIFYAGLIPKLDRLEADIRNLRQPSSGKNMGNGAVSLALTEMLRILDRVRWIASRYRVGLAEPKLGPELLQVWPLFVELYNMVLRSRAYGGTHDLQSKIADAVGNLHQIATKEGIE